MGSRFLTGFSQNTANVCIPCLSWCERNHMACYRLGPFFRVTAGKDLVAEADPLGGHYLRSNSLVG